MTKFAKGDNSKKIKQFFFKVSPGNLLLILYTVLDLGLISIASLGPRASTKVKSHVNFTEPQNGSQPFFFLQCYIVYTKKLAKTIN